ncbi:hypothetical protein HYU11_00190 [Candidatus Woesearchaeota archaeon]|nr:hypothetical protein [Candidatus Woesearchaeota archaeon]
MKQGALVTIAFLLFAVSLNPVSADAGDSFNADQFVYWISTNLEKSTFNLNESIIVSGVLKRANLSNTKTNSTNQTDFYPAPINLTINISIVNVSNGTSTLNSQILVNASSGGIFRTRSSSFPNAEPIYSPLFEGSYILVIRHDDLLNGSAYSVSIPFHVLQKSVDKLYVNPDRARYYSGDPVVVKGSAWSVASDSLTPVANITLNGTLRRKVSNGDVAILSFSCVTGESGACSANFTAPSIIGSYVVEVNNFMASSLFQVIPFDASVYIKSSTGTEFKEILTTNEQAAVEVKVTKNGTVPSGTYIFNGTITDSAGIVVLNITSTKLNDTNGFINRFQFVTNNNFNDGVYKASVHVYGENGSNISSYSFFQVRSWTLYLTKASDNSGFEYEYTAFPVRNVSFELYPKERSNGTLITVLNNSHFNASLLNSMRHTLETSNVTLNSTCGSLGCYKLMFQTPNITGSYVVTISMNFSGVVQVVERSIKVADLTASAFPSTKEGALKELFSTTESVFVSLSAKNTSMSVNITNVSIGSVLYENGTEINYTRVAGWPNVNSNNSVLEWAFNESVGRIMLDTPKQGGAYSIKLFINNNTASASTTFIINPYDVCSSSKSSAGSIDSSSSWYIWQYKTTDTVYVELKIARAQNPAGRASAQNLSSFGSQYGMGMACNINTQTKQVIPNATITVEKVVNAQSGAKQPLNTTATICSADNDQGQYTCIIKPESKWSGGRNIAFLSIVGPDGQTIDKASTIFETRSFYIWAYVSNNAWVQKPSSNISFNVRIYEAGNNWWSNWYSNSQSGGISGSVSVEKVNYMGDYGEWIWPPIDYKYNVTGLNSSNVTNGWGSFSVFHDKTPKGLWQTGTYSVTIKGTNDATGEIDYGEAWFNVRQWESYSTPIESGSYNYKYAFNSKENISLYVRINNAGDYNDGGNASLGGNVSVSVKKIQFYQAGSYKELNTSVFSSTSLNVNVSSPWYWSGSVSAYSNYVLNISRLYGSWAGGWYNVILDINGTETGYGWFNIIPFNVDTQPVSSNGSYTYTSTGTGPIYINVSTTKNKKDSYSWYNRGDYINTTIKDLVLRTWRSDTWESVEYNYPEDFNLSPLSVNGTAIVMINKSGNWDAGYYSGEMIMADLEGSSASGYLWFSVQPFRVSATNVRYTVDVDSNATFNLNVYQPDWSSSSLVYGNYSIASISETLWSGAGYSRVSYTTYSPSSTEWFNATTQLNITPNNNAWSLANGGYRYLTINVIDNSNNASQTVSVSFRAASVSVAIGDVVNRYAVGRNENLTLPITVTKAISGTGATGNLSKIFEWNWPYQTVINFTIDSCNSESSGTCMINSTSAGGVNGTVTRNITIIAPSEGWSEGYHNLNLEFTSSADRSQKFDAGYAWFQVVSPYTGYWYNEDANASWKYYFSPGENITFRLQVMNSSYGCQNARVNVSKVEVAFSANNCWSDYCRKYYEYSFNIINQTAAWIGTPTISGNELNCTERRAIRIINNGTNWEKGNYYVRVNVNGSQGTSLLRTGYFYVRNTNALNGTIHSPVFNSTINGSLFFNMTTTENANCYVNLVNYDTLTNWWCSDQVNNASGTVDNMTVDFRSCRSSNFNGSTYYSIFASKWGSTGLEPGYSFVTGGKEHTANFSIPRLPASQDYGFTVTCYDDDWNSVNRKIAFKVNASNTSAAVIPANATMNLTLLSPADSASFDFTTANFSFMLNHSQGGENDGTSVALIANCSFFTNSSGNWAAQETRNAIIRFDSLSNTEQSNFNISLNLAGSFKWGVSCNGTNSNVTWSSTNRSYNVFDSSNNISINQTEANGTVFSNTSGTSYARLLFNVSIPAVSNLSCQLYMNMTGDWASNWTTGVGVRNNNVLFANFTSNSSYLWNIRCSNGTLTAWGSNRTFSSIVNNGSSQSVSVSLSSPSNNSAFTTNESAKNISFGFSIDRLLANCSLYTNFTGSWAENMSRGIVSSGGQDGNLSMVFSYNGSYSWNVYCSNSSLSGWGASNRTFAVYVGNGTVVPEPAHLNVTLFIPAHNSWSYAGSNVSFRFLWTGGTTQEANCSLYTNLSSTWAINSSTALLQYGTNHTFMLNHSTPGYYMWNVHCANSTLASYGAWGLSNYTFWLNST